MTINTLSNTACTGRLGLGAFFEAGSELWQVSVSELFSPQPPVTPAVGQKGNSMKINRQFQDLHIDGATDKWVLKQHIERDICLLYHQLAEYAGIQPDLYYGFVFALPYWEYLDIAWLDSIERNFIRDGCLVMILAMATAYSGGINAYLEDHLDQCIENLERLTSSDPDTLRLIETVRHALHQSKSGGLGGTAEFTEYTWVHERYVRPYFLDRAEMFRTNPGYKTNVSERFSFSIIRSWLRELIKW